MPDFSGLFVGINFADHMVQEHPGDVSKLWASLRPPMDAAANSPRTFPSTGCRRIFYSEQELTKHWYGRHGRSISGQPDRPSGQPSPQLSALLAQFGKILRSPSPPEERQPDSVASEGQAFGPGSATWSSGAHKLRKGGGPDRGYSEGENRRMRKRAALLSSAKTARPVNPRPRRTSFPVRPPITHPRVNIEEEYLETRSRVEALFRLGARSHGF